MAFPIAAVLPMLGKVIDRVWPDKTEQERMKAQLEFMEQSGELQIMLGQLEINKAEAQHSSLFVAGARPAALWMCVAIFGYHYLAFPIIQSVAVLNGIDVSGLPRFDLEAIWPVMGGLLGLGSFRTYEKYKGVAREKL